MDSMRLWSAGCSRTRAVVICLNDLGTAPVARKECRQIRITHPFHPLHGRHFELLEHRFIFTESYLYFHDDSGHLREIPAVWTDFVKGDAFVELAAGRSPLHARSLLELADLVAQRAKEVGHDV